MQDDGFEFNPNEQKKIIFEENNVEAHINSNIKGRIIHKILQSKTSTAEVENAVNNLFENEKFLVEITVSVIVSQNSKLCYARLYFFLK